MRLLHIHSGNLYGGVESMLRSMARCRALVPVLEPVFALSYDGRIASELRQWGCEVHILGAARASRPFSVLRARAKLASLCARSLCDAAMVHSAWALALLAPAAKCPLILYQHDLPPKRTWRDLWKGRVKPDLVMANSAFVAGRYCCLHPRTPVTTIHPPVQFSSARISSLERREIRTLWKTPADATVILHAGRFESWKGHLLLLEALGKLHDDPRWVLWIAGETQRVAERRIRNEIEERAGHLAIAHRVRFLGHVEDMLPVLQSADIYCQPNTEPEPFGLAFVEALQAELAVVATSMGGALEILAPEWGILAAPNPASVASALRRVLDDRPLREQFAAAGPLRAKALCSPRKQIGAIADLVNSLRAA